MAAKNIRPTAATEAENRGLANSRTSSDGNGMRRSYATKAASMASPATIEPHGAGWPNPWSPPSITP